MILTLSLTALKNTYFVYANELLVDVFENIFINGIKYNQNTEIEIIVKVSVEEKKEDSTYRKADLLKLVEKHQK